MPERRSQRTPYARRSRQAQKCAYWQVLCHIRRAAPVLGGRFYTHNYMHGENGWIDGYFLGKRKPVFYNFAIQTVLFAYKDQVGDRAWDLSYELAPVGGCKNFCVNGQLAGNCCTSMELHLNDRHERIDRQPAG